MRTEKTKWTEKTMTCECPDGTDAGNALIERRLARIEAMLLLSHDGDITPTDPPDGASPGGHERDGVPDNWGTPSSSWETLRQQYIDACMRCDRAESAVVEIAGNYTGLMKVPSHAEAMLLGITPALELLERKIDDMGACTDCGVTLSPAEVAAFRTWFAATSGARDVLYDVLRAIGTGLEHSDWDDLEHALGDLEVNHGIALRERPSEPR